jgi:hypothetical protein
LARSYLTITKDLTRVMVRPKALYRRWAIPCADKQVYAPRHRTEWLAKISEAGVRRRAELYYQQLDALRSLQQQVKRELLIEGRKHSAMKLLRQIPSIGPIRAVLLVALIQTPYRFRTKRQLLSYCGLALETRISGEYRMDGQLQRSKKPVTAHPGSQLMLKCLRILTSLFLLATCAAAAQDKGVNSLLDMAEFIQDWKISKQFTLDVANAMPAELYSFKPNPEEMTFGEQMAHIAGGNVFRFNQITGIQPPFAVDPSKLSASDKQSVLRMLEQSFDYVITTLPQITPQQLQRTWHIPSWKGRTDPDGRAMIVNMLVHTAHHRAQCEVYMRVKGIKPPDYTF